MPYEPNLPIVELDPPQHNTWMRFFTMVRSKLFHSGWAVSEHVSESVETQAAAELLQHQNIDSDMSRRQLQTFRTILAALKDHSEATVETPSQTVNWKQIFMLLAILGSTVALTALVFYMLRAYLRNKEEAQQKQLESSALVLSNTDSIAGLKDVIQTEVAAAQSGASAVLGTGEPVPVTGLSMRTPLSLATIKTISAVNSYDLKRLEDTMDDLETYQKRRLADQDAQYRELLARANGIDGTPRKML